jgi:hypothetical protein
MGVYYVGVFEKDISFCAETDYFYAYSSFLLCSLLRCVGCWLTDGGFGQLSHSFWEYP